MLVGRRRFPDHHPFTPAEIEAVLREARQAAALPVTTPKDAVRLPPDARGAVGVAGVSLEWEQPDAIEALLSEILP